MKQLKLSLAAVAFFALTTTVFTSCSEEEAQTMTVNYTFNDGSIVAYNGSHPTDLSASIKLTEDGDMTKVLVTLNNTEDGEDYNLHVHDVADPNTTPNGTPYNETPNADILAMTITGNGGTASKEGMSTLSYTELTTTYGGGFFVVHDPLQTLSTTDISTYLVVGAFMQ